MTTKVERRTKIKYRVRSKISGTSDCPRMSVFRSNKQIYVQIIDDLSGKTLASASSLSFDEKVVSDGADKLRDGAKVSLPEEEKTEDKVKKDGAPQRP